MGKLRILAAASEVAPFSRTGGLGDVMSALPKALASRGHDVTVVSPLYRSIDRKLHGLYLTATDIRIPINGASHELHVARSGGGNGSVEFLFIQNDDYFGRDGLYTDTETGRDYNDNDERFVFFARAVMCILQQIEVPVDVIHLHDWQTGLIPAYLRQACERDPRLKSTRTVFTIHNLGYQGLFPADRFQVLGLPDSLFYPVTGPFEFYGQVNFIKGGIALSDRITTVSERYAEEIATSEENGYGLQGLLSERRTDLRGILNGVDYDIWSPSRDRSIPFRYGIDNLAGKRRNKVELLLRAGLPMREKTPLITMITRLVDQKGLSLIEEAAEALFAMNLQFILLGTGDDHYDKLFRRLEKQYPDRLKAWLTFDDELAHWIEAGADILLMPSKYEPCGLNQMYSLRYGTVPVVRRVGGLADTVVDIDEHPDSGTGFVFDDFSADALLEAVTRAIQLYARRREWIKLMKRGMRQKFVWDRAARQYEELFVAVSEVATKPHAP